jgi:RES domain-containing protein
MVLWRISRHRDLDGAGGFTTPGRWHHAGHPIVYLAQNPASALLEVCVHTSANDVPPDFTLLRVEGPDQRVPVISVSSLTADWTSCLEVTRDLGSAWLKRRESVLLQVPSAIVPETTNMLFNPVHREAKKFVITREFSYPFDVRLKR